MRIGIITPANLPVPAVFGGAIETLIEDFIDENERVLIHEIVVFSEYEKKARKLSRKYVKTKFKWFNGSKIYFLISLIFRVLKKIKIIKIDYQVFFVSHYVKKLKLEIVIVEGKAVYVKYLKKNHKSKSKILFHIHARLKEAENPQLVDALEFSDKIIVVSEFIKSDLLKRFNLNPDRIAVVYNCASHTFFKREVFEHDKLSLKKELRIDSNDFVLIFAGRLVPDKGLLELVRSCKQLIGRIKFKLLIIGSFGSDFGKRNCKKSNFQKEVLNELQGIEQNFIFCGYISNALISNYYAIADVAIVPSLYNEAGPLVPIEAMAAELPVIYSSKGGIREYVSPECGIMVDMDAVDSVERIAFAIKLLYEDIELRRNMSVASYNRSMLFNPKSYYECLNNVIVSESANFEVIM